MRFKAVITEECIDVQGTKMELLTGLLCYIDTLEKSGISENIIKQVIGLKYNDINKKKNGKIEIQKIDFNNVTKEEAKKILDEEIISKIFD